MDWRGCAAPGEQRRPQRTAPAVEGDNGEAPPRWRRPQLAATALEKASSRRVMGNAAMTVRVGKCCCFFGKTVKEDRGEQA